MGEKGEWKNVLRFASQVRHLYLRHNILRDISCQKLQIGLALKYFYAEQTASLQIIPFLKYQLADWVCRNDILLLTS